MANHPSSLRVVSPLNGQGVAVGYDASDQQPEQFPLRVVSRFGILPDADPIPVSSAACALDGLELLCRRVDALLDVRQLVASRNETLRQMTVTLLGLSDESLNAVLPLACRLRKLEGLPSPD